MRPCVVLTPDANFELPLAVALVGLSQNHREVGCRIVILHDDVPTQMQRRVEAEVQSPSTVEWQAVDRSLLAECAPPRHMPRASLHTLVVPELLSRDIKRAIYLDVDVVVGQSLLPLWAASLDGSGVGAVRGAYMPWMAAVDRFPWRALGLAPDTPYFNNGLMLMDVDLWRRERVMTRAAELLRVHTLPYGEQDALNVLFAGRWTPLHPRWNLQSGHFADPGLAWVTESTEALDDALKDPAVIHYNGPVKPWHHGCTHPLASRWFGWLDRTQYRGWRPSP